MLLLLDWVSQLKFGILSLYLPSLYANNSSFIFKDRIMSLCLLLCKNIVLSIFYQGSYSIVLILQSIAFERLYEWIQLSFLLQILFVSSILIVIQRLEMVPLHLFYWPCSHFLFFIKGLFKRVTLRRKEANLVLIVVLWEYIWWFLRQKRTLRAVEI